MLALRRAQERGHFDHGWLDTWHSFSFAAYRDPAHMGFRALRVINDDTIAPGAGFGTHGHRDMEILTYVIDGALAHRDSMGNGRTIAAGEVQGMSAGTGIQHSEFNASAERPVHLLQVWIEPHTKGVTPSYAEWKPADHQDGWVLAASGFGEEGAIPIHQHARMYVGHLRPGDVPEVPLTPGRYGWLQVAIGEIMAGEVPLRAGDGLAFAARDGMRVSARQESRVLLFDLA